MKIQLQKPVSEKRKFTKQYKQEALEHWKSSGRSAATVAAELGIRPPLLYRWQRQSRVSEAYVVNPVDSNGVITSRVLSSKREGRTLLVGQICVRKTRAGGLMIPLSVASLNQGKRTRLRQDQTLGHSFRLTSLYRLKGCRAFTWP
jgi:hypothetical protein